MPYIKSEDGRRTDLQFGDSAKTAGELNYQIFYYVKHFEELGVPQRLLEEDVSKFVRQFLGDKPNYQRYNDMTGALIRCYREIKRRLNIDAYFIPNILDKYDNEIAKYEDLKILENSDVE
jgi:hypothetical protein